MANPIDRNSESLTPDLLDPDALKVEIDRVRKDKEFMDHVGRLVERNREILDRLAE